MRHIAIRFLLTHGLTFPLRADVALYAARFFPLPSPGPAGLDGNILHYDESRPGWDLEVWDLVCGRLLREAEHPDEPVYRVELARWFGVDLVHGHAMGPF